MAKWIVFFVIACAAVLIGGALAVAYLPRATVTLVPATTTRTAEQEVLLSREVAQPDFAEFLLPAQIIEKEIAHIEEVERTGNATEGLATGTVVLVNNLQDEQQLVPKTHLRHEETGVQFLTDRPVAIPPNESRPMTVTAKEPGVAGEVSPGRFVIEKLPAESQQHVYGESAEQFMGGLTVEDPLTEEELHSAVERARAAGEERARSELLVAAGGAPLREDLVVVKHEETTTSAHVGDTPRTLVVTSRYTARAMRVDDKALLGLTTLSVQRSADNGEQFAEFDPSSFRVEIIRSDFERGEALVKGTVDATYAQKLEPSLLDPAPLLGRSAEEVRDFYGELSSVSDAAVAFWPFWVQSVPSRLSAVTVEVSQD